MFLRYISFSLIFFAHLSSRRYVLANAKSFRSSDSLSSFDDHESEHHGSIVQDYGDGYKDSKSSYRFSQQYDPAYKGRYHSEVIVKNAYKTGDTAYYATTFKLPDKWEFTNQIYTIVQFIADFDDWREGETVCHGWSPSTKIWLQGDSLYIRTRHDTVCTDHVSVYKISSSVTRDVWHKLVFGVKWASTPTGFLEVWYDGRKVIEKHQITTTMKADKRPYELRVGLYCTSWHNDEKIVGSQGKREMWHDKIAIGPSYKYVDPDEW